MNQIFYVILLHILSMYKPGSMRKTLVFFIFFFAATNVFGQTKSYKRGVSYGYHSQNDMENFSPDFSWWYNWATQPESAIRDNYQDYNVDFTPMAWNASGINGVYNWVAQDPNVKYILGFNEPNFKDQANMTPSAAAAAWSALQTIAETHDLKIVGPAVNYCGNCVSENGTVYNNPFTYLDDFFSACTDCQVDFVALHWYGGGNSIVGYVEEARKYNKPIWVTEFAAWDNSVSNLEGQKKHLAGVVNFLERDPDIYRYSWFIGRTSGGITSYPYIDLYGSDGELTELGELYMAIPVYDPNMMFQIPGRIETEEYYLMSGLYTEPTEDNDGFLNIGWTEPDDWAEYKLDVQSSGSYNLKARVAGTNPGEIAFYLDDALATVVTTPNTGNWQSWTDISTTIELEAGEHMLKMHVNDGGFNINWIDLIRVTETKEESIKRDIKIYPNPSKNGLIYIEIENQELTGEFTVIVQDVIGGEAYYKKINQSGSSFQLDLNEKGIPASGIYFLNISGKGINKNSRLVIQ